MNYDNEWHVHGRPDASPEQVVKYLTQVLRVKEQKISDLENQIRTGEIKRKLKAHDIDEQILSLRKLQQDLTERSREIMRRPYAPRKKWNWKFWSRHESN